ncbi:carboxypeptidase regulatory-like domain-containing protein [Ramlibacter pallidus]|uniref:Carboxypeptidase regulatory-like domain-containing protein n=1 Tax=Ramlibacter pallidus TaxID=2780087 RepID=A0ABR9RXT8_9BURK|nr:carboxypeptidase regulatory-like domain-containing protein [Ramlibacter pallidus]MBE7366057.1 carboxypeptidase regulatory-like domain-containing protein [Ramlibacter pallidus]
MKKHILIGLAVAQAAALAFAQGAGQAEFRCGGVGDAEQQQFKAQAADHDMLVTFASTTGAYVADVDVKITGADGKVVLQARCGGPLMLVNVPGSGPHQVEASFNGQSQRKAVTVGKQPARLSFTWSVS